MEVSALAREATNHLYPTHCKLAFAFSILPHPQPCGLTLRLTFPKERNDETASLKEENYGLATFRVSARVG